MCHSYASCHNHMRHVTFVWVMSHSYEACQIHMRHVTFMWVMSHSYESCQIYMRHVTFIETCHIHMGYVTFICMWWEGCSAFTYLSSFFPFHFAFITWNINLIPLLEGLCSSNPCRFEFSIFWGLARIEPTTSGLRVPRSDQLSWFYIVPDVHKYVHMYIYMYTYKYIWI